MTKPDGPRPASTEQFWPEVTEVPHGDTYFNLILLDTSSAWKALTDGKPDDALALLKMVQKWVTKTRAGIREHQAVTASGERPVQDG